MFVISSLMLLAVAQVLANGVIARVNQNSNIATLLAQYPQITGVDRAGSSPFYRFEVTIENELVLRDCLNASPLVSWAEAEDFTGNNVIRSSRGSSLAAIFDLQLSAPSNDHVWSQINFVPSNAGLSGVRVGIVDTGVSPLQPELRDRVVAGRSFFGNTRTIDDLPNDVDTNRNGVFDEATGHGTMIAGIITQMAPNAQLVIARSADSDGVASTWSAIEGIVFCVENDAQIINFSLGSRSPLAGFTGLINWLEQQNVLLVAPIGNNADGFGVYPSMYSKVVCVTGLDHDNTKAAFSNWNWMARVAAPAVGIESHWWDGSMRTASGTSLSAPLVVGALASLPNGIPSSPWYIRKALRESGQSIDDLNPQYHCRLGKLLDVQSLRKYLRDHE